MTAKLSVTVAVDPDVATVTVRTGGTLSCQNVHGLIALVRRAERSLPGFSIALDLSQLKSGPPEAFRAIRESGARVVPRTPVNDRRSEGPSPAVRVAA